MLERNEKMIVDEEVKKLTKKEMKKLTKQQINRIKTLNPIYIFNPLTQKDRPISYHTDNIRTFHITLNPLKYQTVDEIKSAFNYAKNRYGRFIYGRHWTEQLKLNYDLAIEKQYGYRHIHLILRDMSINETAIFYNYMTIILNGIYPKLSTYCKIQEKDIVLLNKGIGKNEMKLINYDSKKQNSNNTDNETFFYSSRDFIK